MWLQTSVTSEPGMEAESQLMNFLTLGPVIVNNSFILDSNSCLNWYGNLRVIHPGSSCCIICLFRVFIGSAHSCLEPAFHLHLNTLLHCLAFHSELTRFPLLFAVSSVSFSLPSLMRTEIMVSSGPSLLNPRSPI